jgi:hypothetical protein
MVGGGVIVSTGVLDLNDRRVSLFLRGYSACMTWYDISSRLRLYDNDLRLHQYNNDQRYVT